jgi:hypothetical protein
MRMIHTWPFTQYVHTKPRRMKSSMFAQLISEYVEIKKHQERLEYLLSLFDVDSGQFKGLTPYESAIVTEMLKDLYDFNKEYKM